MDSDPLIKDVNNILRKLDIYPVQKYTAHKRVEFNITKETIEKCYKEKKELDTVKNIIKNYAKCHKGEIYFIDDKDEIGLDNDQLNVLISKHVSTWIKDDGASLIPIYSDDPEIIDPLIVSLNNSPILKESLNAHILLFGYSNRDFGRDMGIIVERQNVGNPAYKITEELIQWVKDFSTDKKVNPITCFIEHQGVDNFTGANASNGTAGIVE